MKVGGIYKWVTDQAIGHDTRPKMHVYICPGNWQTKDYVFLFINKSDFGGGYRIEKKDGYDFLTYDCSFISSSSIVSYSTDELRSAKIEHLGFIQPPHMKQLYTAIYDSDFMDGWQIKMVCGALVQYL